MLEQIVKDIADTVKENVQAGIKTVSEKFEIRFKALEEKIDSIPAGEKGEPGKDGDPGKDGKDGDPGKDGASPSPDEVAKSMEGLFSKWALDFERKADGILEKAVDRIPKPKDGVDGRDALEIENFELSLGDDGRTVTASLKRGEVVIEKSIKLSTILDRGVYKDAQQYEKGDGVTYGGCFWLSQKDAPQGKPGSSDDWRLAVKKGRDGRESVKIVPQDKVKV